MGFSVWGLGVGVEDSRFRAEGSTVTITCGRPGAALLDLCPDLGLRVQAP